MRLVEYLVDAAPRLGVVTQEGVVAVQDLAVGLPGRMLDLIRAGDAGLEDIARALEASDPIPSVRHIEGISIGPPLPNPPKLLCVAANYSEHIVECGLRAPALTATITPQFFCKFPSTCIVGPNATIPLNRRNVAVDWELELAVVIGRGGRNIELEAALDHVFGYTIINDISERKLNADLANREVRANDQFFDWLNGKWFDGFAPLGPAIVTADEIPDPQALDIRLEVNGEVMQNSSTAKMISTVAQLIAYLSQYVTLEAGDIIATGTPEGTGVSRGRFLKPGDRMRGFISNLGCLENTIGSAPQSA